MNLANLSTHPVSVDDFMGNVFIDGQGGNNQLTIDDSGDTTGDVIVQRYAANNYVNVSGIR